MQTQLQAYFEKNLPHYFEFLKEMVEINSFTANPDGVNTLVDVTAGRFSQLGFVADRIQSANPEFGKHLVLTRKGTSGRVLGLVSHLDTVFPPEEEAANDFHWRVEGDRIYGPGTNDIKGGTVMIYMVMEAIQTFAPEIFDAITWVVLLNASEERLSEDFGALCRQRLGENAIAALVFEAGYYDDENFTLVAARKGMAIYEITVEGKAAHAGNQHLTGANAIVQMAAVIQKIADLTDYANDLTYNVGVISGGTVPNRVPHFVKARGEMRTFRQDVYQQGVEDLLKINQIKPLTSQIGGFRCKIDLQVTQENTPWPRNSDTDQLIELWQETAETMGKKIILEARGGLSDGNYLWDFVPTVDGLGPDGRNAHCSERSADGSKDQEYVTKSSFIPKAILNTVAILKLTTPT